MNKLMNTTIALGILLAGAGVISCDSSAAEARPRYKTRVNKRQSKQNKRVRQGVKSGELTKGELVATQKRRAHIAKKEAQFRLSGNGLSKKEAAKLEIMQDRNSAFIYKQKHDGQTR